MLNYTISEDAAAVASANHKITGKDIAEVIGFAFGIMFIPATLMFMYVLSMMH